MGGRRWKVGLGRMLSRHDAGPGAVSRNIRINDSIRNLCIREGSADGRLIGLREELAWNVNLFVRHVT